MQFELNAQSRTVQGSGASRRLRRAGKVPGVVYGGAAAAVAIEVDHNELILALRKEAFHASVISLKLDGKAETVVLREAQMHPYKALVLHADFQRVDTTHAIHQKVPLHFVNGDQAPGVKLGGGKVTVTMNEVDVTCLPQDLPAFIEVDLKDLQAGATIHVSQLVLPKGVKPVVHGSDDPVVVSIPAKKAAAGGEEEAPAA